MAVSEQRKDRRRSWLGRLSISNIDSVLPSPQEGKEQTYFPTSPNPSGPGGAGAGVGVGGILPFMRSNSGQPLASVVSPRPTTPLAAKRRSGSSTACAESLSQGGHNGDPDQIQNAHQLERTISSVSTQSNSTMTHPASLLNKGDARGSFSKMSLGSMFSSLSRPRSNQGHEEERGRPQQKHKERERDGRSSSYSGTHADRDSSGSRARSQSPFRLRRLRRDPSPAVEALTQSDVESDAESARIRPRNAFSTSYVSDDESGDETEDDGSSEDESWDADEEKLDDITEQNTEANTLVPAVSVDQDVPDYLGEGVNVVVPPEPYFPSTLNGQGRNPRRRKSMKPQDTLPLNTSRPIFQRDRCVITVTHGSPERIHNETGRPGKRYVLASDLSEESRFAMEWAIGTVLKDGDQL